MARSLALLVFASAIVSFAQEVFEIASIRSSAPEVQGSIQREGRTLRVTGYTPKMLLLWAFDVREDRLAGRLVGLDSSRYDVQAQGTAEPMRGELQRKMQTLLVERFGLKYHREERNLPFLALVLDRGGAKVKISAAPQGAANNAFGMTQPGRLTGTNVTAAMLANVLSNQTGRSVQDFTGLTGIFDFVLNWAPDGVDEGDESLPSLSTALREQLGLRLESRRGRAEVVVVDAMSAIPTEN